VRLPEGDATGRPPRRHGRGITVRIPKRRISGVVAGLIRTLPRNSAITTSPPAADHPNPSWKNSASRNGMALLITARKTEPPSARGAVGVDPQDPQVEQGRPGTQQVQHAT